MKIGAVRTRTLSAIPLGCLAAAACTTPDTAQTLASSAHASSAQPADAAKQQASTARAIDAGTIDVDGIDVPVRGVVTMPEGASRSEPVPLVVFGHLRTPNCSDETFAYPCPAGTEEVRPDKRTEYLGEALAQDGYAMLIPDFSVAYLDGISEDGEVEVVRQIVRKLSAEAQLSDVADAAHPGLMVHSRSATMVEPIAAGLGAENIEAVLAYGPVYATPGQPAGPDVDYLAMMGERDFEASDSANLWISEHIGAPREHAATAVSVPALGHNFVNRALSGRDFDDRIDCDLEECATAAEHEEFLIDTARGFFADRKVPDHSRLLRATPGEAAKLAPRDFTGEVCQRKDSMDPTPVPNECEDSGVNAIISFDEMLRLGTARAEVEVPDASHIAVHALPVDQPTRITVTVHYPSGEAEELEIGPDSQMLRDRYTDTRNWIYLVGTEQLELSGGDVVAVELEAPDGPVEVRGVDIF